MKDLITISDFAKVGMVVGEVKGCEGVEGSNKLLKLLVFFGNELGEKIIYSGIKAWYTPESLVGRKLIFVVNLQPKKFIINGVEVESQGMLVAVGDNDAVLYTLDKDIEPGTEIR